MDIETKHLKHIQEMQAMSGMGEWYSWNSPIGLTIFFLGGSMSLGLLAWIIKFFFFMK